MTETVFVLGSGNLQQYSSPKPNLIVHLNLVSYRLPERV